MDRKFRNISDVYSAFMSPDGIYMKLPIPIDSYLYEVCMDHDHLCKKDRDKFKQTLGNPYQTCGRPLDKVCGSVFTYVQRIKFDIDNIGKILRRYEITIFDTKEKAFEAGKKIKEKRIQQLREMGFNIDDEGKLIEESSKAVHENKSIE